VSDSEVEEDNRWNHCCFLCLGHYFESERELAGHLEAVHMVGATFSYGQLVDNVRKYRDTVEDFLCPLCPFEDETRVHGAVDFVDHMTDDHEVEEDVLIDTEKKTRKDFEE
jgi:hypothetical protein